MTRAQMLRRLKRTIEELPEERLAMVQSMLDMVVNDDEDAATNELLAIPGFLKEYRRGMRDIKAGRVVKWRDVRRAV